MAENGKRKTVAVFFGGRSAEHEVSIVSARSVLGNLDPDRFRAFAVFVDKEGVWRKADAESFSRDGVLPRDRSSVLVPVPSSGGGLLYEIKKGEVCGSFPVDAAFSVIHGTDGEDGAIQGVFEIWNIPYAGAPVLGSAVASDKLVAKQLLQNAGLPVVEFAGVEKKEWLAKGEGALSDAVRRTGFPCFVKPSNLGSSIGIFRVEKRGAIAAAAAKSFQFSDTVIVESAVPDAREIEVGVLGVDSPETSVPGEIVPAGEFYDYEAKYGDTGSELIVPASLPSDVEKNIRSAALKTFSVLRCTGMARVDFLLDSSTGRFFVSELNTIPGFTPISMYPKLWEASGISYRDLISRVIDFAFESSARKQDLKTGHCFPLVIDETL